MPLFRTYMIFILTFIICSELKAQLSDIAVDDGTVINVDKNGHYTRKTTTGLLLQEGYIKNGKPVGSWKFYDTTTGKVDRSVNMSSTFIKSSQGTTRSKKSRVVKTKKPDGSITYKYYSLNGALFAMVETKNKQANGKAVYYDTITSYKTAEGNHYKNKRKGEWVFYAHLTGKLHGIEYYQNGVMQGPAEYYDTVNKYEHNKDIKIAEGQYDNNLRVGVWTYYTPSGFVEARETYKDSLLNGISKYYYEKTGHLVYEGDFKNGIADGWVRLYDSVTGYKITESKQKAGVVIEPVKYFFNDERGVVSLIENYDSNMLAIQGDHFDSLTGIIKERYHYRNNEIVSYLQFSSKGALVDSVVFDDNREIKLLASFDTLTGYIASVSETMKGNRTVYNSFYKNGSIESQTGYKGSVLDGEYRYYDSLTGSVLVEGAYDNGKRCKIWKYYEPNNHKLVISQEFKDDVLEGTITLYDTTGNVQSTVSYVDGVKNGKAIFYFYGADIKRVVFSNDNDSIDGKLTTFYRSGKIKREERYKKGKLLKSKCYAENGLETECTPLVVKSAFKGDVMTYIGDNLRYPEEALKNNIEGKVLVQFIINETGAISNVEVLDSLGYGCDKEAVRLVKGMPHWQPLIFDGVPNKDVKTLPIVFWLNDQ